MHQELITPPPLFSRTVYAGKQKRYALPARFTWSAFFEMLIVLIFLAVVGSIVFQILHINSGAMQLAQAQHDIVSCFAYN